MTLRQLGAIAGRLSGMQAAYAVFLNKPRRQALEIIDAEIERLQAEFNAAICEIEKSK